MDVRTTLRLDMSPESIELAGRVLRAGGLVAMPTETVYGLAAIATNAAAVEGIFAAKRRPHWDPLIVHVADREDVVAVAQGVDAVSAALMHAFWPGPLTLLLPRRLDLPSAVTAGREFVAVRMPAHPVSQGIIRAAASPLAAPSANLFGHVSPTTAQHVLDDLDGRIDAVVDAGSCGIGVESTVAHCMSDEVVIYRAGGVTVAQVASVTGLPVRTYLAPDASGTPESLPSPGVGIRHYATRATILLVDSQEELVALLAMPARYKAGVLLPKEWHLNGHAGPVQRWAAMHDAPALAEGLYRALRALDATGVQEIVVPLPAEKSGLFAAVHDRLQKAARPR